MTLELHAIWKPAALGEISELRKLFIILALPWETCEQQNELPVFLRTRLLQEVKVVLGLSRGLRAGGVVGSVSGSLSLFTPGAHQPRAGSCLILDSTWLPLSVPAV